MNDFEIVGSGNVGDKAKQLIAKTETLKKIGFQVPRRTILSEDFFDGFFQRNNIGDRLSEPKDIAELDYFIKKGSFTKEQFEVLQRVSETYGISPLVVRSSAAGDSRGTGTYLSEFSENNIGRLKKTIKMVIASYFSESAISFRKDAKTPEGFAVMIEPIFGQDLMWDLYGPMFSGYGYTSTSKGDGYINIVPGLGGGVDRRDSEKITLDALKEVNGNLQDYVLNNAHIKLKSGGRKSALFDFDRIGYFQGIFGGKAYSFPDRLYMGDSGGISRTTLDFTEKEELKQAYSELNLNPLFDMMKRMEDKFGKAQYFEWALTFEDGEQKFGLLQIADIDKKLDEHLDLGNLENRLLVANNVTGSGVKECSKLFRCWNPDDRDALYDFNQKNKDYALVYPARLVTSMNTRYCLNYKHFSNASVFLEIPDANHCVDPISHLTGQLDMTGKFFGVLDYDLQTEEMWDRLELKLNDKVYLGNIKAYVSERQDKMVICAVD